MSSSSGELLTLSDLLEVYEPQIIRWIFASHRPNHDFSIALDEDVIKVYDEFDKAKAAFATKKLDDIPKKKISAYRAYLFSQLESNSIQMNTETLQLPSFRILCNQLQICNHDIERTFEKYYANKTPDLTLDLFTTRAKRASFWLKHHAPENFKYTLRTSPPTITLSETQIKAVKALHALLHTISLDDIDTKELNQLIWEKTIRLTSCESKDAFQAFYQLLIARDQGPRLPAFLKEIGKEKLLHLLTID